MLHFWARKETRSEGKTNPLAPQPDLSFNQTSMGLEIVLRQDKPGAIGIEHQCAQGSSIQIVRAAPAGGAVRSRFRW